MKNRKSDETKQVIVRRYEHYFERRTYGDLWQVIVAAIGGAILMYAKIRLSNW